MRPSAKTLAAFALAAGFLAACGSSRSDKAGGIAAPTVLDLAVGDNASGDPGGYPAFFADEVRRLSAGHMRVKVKLFAGGSGADAEPRVGKMVTDGHYELGAIAARAWDELGVTSFEALQAPFLITDQSVLKAVVQSPLAAEMLDGLRTHHVVGLALLAGGLRHPVGYAGPLRTPADFRGKRIRVQVSRVNDAIVAALGARPLHLGFNEVGPLVVSGRLDGQEMPLVLAPVHGWVTANVALSAKALTLFANADAYERLSGEQREILRTAAARTAAHVIDSMTPEAELAEGYCKIGHVFLATSRDRSAFVRATRPAYARLERDPQVAKLIAAIEEIKGRTQPDPAPALSGTCGSSQRASGGVERDPNFLDGTYRWRITRAGARRRGSRPDDPDIGTVQGMTLRGGHWTAGVGNSAQDTGTFKVRGNRITFTWPSVGSILTFGYRRSRDGALSLEPVLPMDIGDQVVWSSSPWTRVGPPVR